MAKTKIYNWNPFGMLGPVYLGKYVFCSSNGPDEDDPLLVRGIKWVMCGGETGPDLQFCWNTAKVTVSTAGKGCHGADCCFTGKALQKYWRVFLFFKIL